MIRVTNQMINNNLIGTLNRQKANIQAIENQLARKNLQRCPEAPEEAASTVTV